MNRYTGGQRMRKKFKRRRQAKRIGIAVSTVYSLQSQARAHKDRRKRRRMKCGGKRLTETGIAALVYLYRALRYCHFLWPCIGPSPLWRRRTRITTLRLPRALHELVPQTFDRRSDASDYHSWSCSVFDCNLPSGYRIIDSRDNHASVRSFCSSIP